MKNIAVIGSGFSGLAAAACLAQKGHKVTVLEKNDHLGGRARQFQAEGFTFDMGPSWYWMPDVFESYFQLFGKSAADFYTLKRLDPSYSVFFGKDEVWEIPAEMDAMEALFERIEPGSALQLRKFLAEAAYKYEVGINDLVYKPGLKLGEFADARLLNGLLKMHVLKSFHSYVRKYFTDSRLIRLLEFPILFLGAMPRNTPALYSLMNHADISLGTWYPMGGMYRIVEGMVDLAKSLGVEFQTGSPVSHLPVDGQFIRQLDLNGGHFPADAVVASADYHHVEQHLLPASHRRYTEDYWDKRTMAPSCLLFYLGLNKRLTGLQHHNLFFDEDFHRHAEEIYETPKWPTKPLFYACVPSLTDSTVAPEGHENLFLLVPVAPNLEDPEEVREKYYNLVMDRLESLTGQSIRPHVIYKRSYAHRDFESDYHSFKGNAYGLANTLRQTAILKPSILNKKVKNLFYTGQLTVPGPGVPPSIISGQVVANLTDHYLKVQS